MEREQLIHHIEPLLHLPSSNCLPSRSMASARPLVFGFLPAAKSAYYIPRWEFNTGGTFNGHPESGRLKGGGLESSEHLDGGMRHALQHSSPVLTNLDGRGQSEGLLCTKRQQIGWLHGHWKLKDICHAFVLAIQKLPPQSPIPLRRLRARCSPPDALSRCKDSPTAVTEVMSKMSESWHNGGGCQASRDVAGRLEG
jgi:hypothetical protein